MPDRLNIAEATSSLPAAPAESGRMLVQLITPGWGSSGYYSPGVLAEAAQSKVFPAGTHMYLDHPTQTESADRPERSVRDLAAVLTEDAKLDDAGGLSAPAQVFAPYRPLLTDPDMREAIGVSIRATGQAEAGEADGRSGLIISRLDEGLSVDFVTKAGRGGKVLSLLESARPPAVAEAMSSDIRDALSNAVNQQYGGEDIYVWVRDYDADSATVYFDVDGNTDDRATFSQAYTLAADGAATLDGDRTEVTVRTQYVPTGGTPAVPSPTTTQESREDSMPTLTEAEATALTERATTAERERDEARRQLAESAARDNARPLIAAALAESAIPDAARQAVTDRIAAQVALTSDGQLDRTRLDEAIAAEKTYAAHFAVTNGAGSVTGAGSAPAGDTNPSGGITEAEYDKFADAHWGNRIHQEA